VGTGPELAPFASRISGTWARFAHTGNPNGNGLPTWPAYSADTRSVLIINKTSRVENDPRRQERLVISSIKAHQ
jgi:para-nitrobenzyl esterase